MDGGGDSENSHLHHPFKLSPLLIGLIGIVSGSIMVALYQWITIGFNHYRGTALNPTPLRRQRNSHNPARTTAGSSDNRAQLQVVPVYKYTKGCREGTCAVCLCEFSEGEEIRTLPQCMHSFHAPCVDMWLHSHSNCPLCRAHTSPPRQHSVVEVPNSDEVPPPELEEA